MRWHNMILRQEGFTKKCGKCGAEKPVSEFFRNRTRKDGYGHRCKSCCKSHERAHNATCQMCGKTYYASTASMKLYCSRKCSATARDRRVDVICEQCGSHFTAHKYEIESGIGRFCSRSCAMSARSGEKCPSWRGGTVELTCETCGQPFTVGRYRVGAARFCSMKCKGEWQSKEFCREKHPLWKGGWSVRDYPTEWGNKFRKCIRERDGYTCAVCGEWGNQVHHIDYIKAHTTSENCITLCVSCHSKTNFNRESWQARLSAVVAKRMEGSHD